MFELDAGGREDYVAGDVDGVLFARVQGVDLVLVHHQRAVVSGVRFTVHQGPGLVDGTGARTGSVKATRRMRVAGAPGVRRSRREVAMRNAGDVPVKPWARTLPSVA